MSARVLVINGPNLNMLGKREPKTYGTETLAQVEAKCKRVGAELGLEVTCFQANSEGLLIRAIHEARETQDGIVINAGAYTHTSIAIRDALSAAEKPIVEVHLSNVHARESFRHISYISAIAIGVVVGFGSLGYEFALKALAQRFQIGA
ncbi:MAG TPA: type II 3-dehydroquinate dehydratase [Steroidobacter sp.]|uniref:type II 3-dehydroquinate dehydratase n=1 Tax=Steroidobacter sp. TaxID=1978227 RepID=UPI002ED846FD